MTEREKHEHYDVDRWSILLADLYLQLLTIRIGHMHGAGDAGVEAVDGAEDFDGLIGVVEFVAFGCGFVGAVLAHEVARAGVPGAGDDGLVVVDLLILDDDPMRVCAARGFHLADANARVNIRA